MGGEAMSVERITPGASLIEILERVLDKGIVLDGSARVSQAGIDLMTDDAADCGGLDPDVPEVSHHRRMNRGDTMRFERRTMILGMLTIVLGEPRLARAAAGARPPVTVHRSPT